MSAWKALVAAIIIFCAGALTGGTLVHVWSKPTAQAAGPRFPSAAGRVQRTEYVHRLEKVLSLTSPQKERIEQILRESQEQMRKLCDPISAGMERQTLATREKIQAVLTPEQLVKYREFTKNRPGRRGSEGAPREGPWERRRNDAFGLEPGPADRSKPMRDTNGLAPSPAGVTHD